MSHTTQTVLIAASGTGGHLFPAIAVAEALKRTVENVQIRFVGSGRDVERHIIARAGYELIELRVKPLKGKSVLLKLGALAMLVPAVLTSWTLVRKLHPSLVIGAGGYVSGPLVMAASLSCPTFIFEVNLRPGLTTRWLAPFTRCVVCSFRESVPMFGRKGVWAGHPVRPEFFAIRSRVTPAGISGDRPFHVLVFGGSQGSTVLNNAVMDALPLWPTNAKLVHQTGTKDFEKARDAHEAAGSGAVVSAFIDRMADAFAEADLIVCRAGASTIAEIAAAGRPAILVPFAAAADNHQELNARAMERAGAAVVLTERELTPRLLCARMEELMAAPDKRAAMSDAARCMANPDAAAEISRIAARLMHGGPPGAASEDRHA